MSGTRSKLQDAYKAAVDLAETPEERKEVRDRFRDLFKAVVDDRRAEKKVDEDMGGIRIPLPDPFGMLTGISRGKIIEVFDPLREMVFPAEEEQVRGGVTKRSLCKDLDQEELAEYYCEGSDDVLGCIDAVIYVLDAYNHGQIETDEEFNRTMRATLLDFGIDKNINFKRNIEIRSPCFATEVEKICGADIECMETIEKMVESIDDPDRFKEIMEEARIKYAGR